MEEIYELLVENYNKEWTEKYYLAPLGGIVVVAHVKPNKELEIVSSGHGWNLRNGGRVDLRTLTKKETEEVREDLEHLIEEFTSKHCEKA